MQKSQRNVPVSEKVAFNGVPAPSELSFRTLLPLFRQRGVKMEGIRGRRQPIVFCVGRLLFLLYFYLFIYIYSFLYYISLGVFFALQIVAVIIKAHPSKHPSIQRKFDL